MLHVRPMLEWRSEQRFRLTEPADGVLRVFLDATVHRNGDEWIAISREPAAVGETLMLDVLDVDAGCVGGHFVLCVQESRPIIVDGRVRHRVRLHDGLPPVLLEQQIRR